MRMPPPPPRRTRTILPTPPVVSASAVSVGSGAYLWTDASQIKSIQFIQTKSSARVVRSRAVAALSWGQYRPPAAQRGAARAHSISSMIELADSSNIPASSITSVAARRAAATADRFATSRSWTPSDADVCVADVHRARSTRA